MSVRITNNIELSCNDCKELKRQLEKSEKSRILASKRNYNLENLELQYIDLIDFIEEIAKQDDILIAIDSFNREHYPNRYEDEDEE